MNQKDGQQVCDRCSGEGCYHCERKGYVLSCPSCMAQYAQTKVDDHFRCGVCGSTYGKSGDLLTGANIPSRSEREALVKKKKNQG